MNLPLILLFGVFVVLLLLGAPTYLALLAGGLSYFFLHPEIDAMAVCQKMFSSLDSFVLIAVPLFMIAGNLMNSGGITDRIFNFAKSIVGHLPGGLGHVNVISSFIFSGMSGSALADVGGLGQVEIKAMKEENYDDDLTLGITAASATMGPIVPPSIPMVVYGATSGVSIGALFLAGLGPGILMLVVLCAVTAFVATRRHYPVHKRTTAKERWIALRRGALSLLMPIITMGGIVIILALVYKEMTFKDMVRVLYETAEGFVPALTIVVASSLFGWVLQFEHIDQKMIEFFFSITSNKYIITLFLNILLLICGMFLDSTPVILLFVPMFLPLGEALGIHDVQMGVMIVLNLMIGLMTPPIGQSLFIMATTTNNRFEYVVKNTWKWFIPLRIVLLLTAYIPDVTLFLPRLFGLIKP